MGLFARIAGVTASFFQLGGTGGAGLNNNGGTAIEVKNAANSAFVVSRAADPVGPNDLVTLEFLQATYPNLATQKVIYFNGQNIQGSAPAAGNSGWGWNNFSSTAVTFNHPVLTTATRLSATSRFQAQTTTSTQLGIRELGQLYAWRGNAAGVGGFTFRCRFSLEGIATTATFQSMIGLIGALGPVITTNWVTDTTISKVGMAFTATSAAGVLTGNWKIVEGSTAAITVHDLGASFPLTAAHYLELIMTAVSNDTKISYTVNNLTTGATTSGTLNTTLPANTVFLCPYIQCNTQTGASGTTLFSVSDMVLVLNDG